MVNRNEVIKDVLENKIIVIMRGFTEEQLVNSVEAMWKGGVRLVEVTFDQSGQVDDATTASYIKLLSEKFKGRVRIGAGTVMSPKQVVVAAKAGAEFIISPDTCKDVIKKTRKLGLVSMPGALTPSEIQTAHRAGADFVKMFPITNMGPEYVKAVKAPLSHIKLLAVGGVDNNNMPDYLKVGISGFGIGSNITDKKMIANEDWAGITKLAEVYVAAAKQ